MFERLGLTDDQKAAVHAVREKNAEGLRPLGEAARRAHEAFQKALDTEPADATKVGQLAVAMNAAQKKFDAARKAEMDEIKAILTPEQREKLDQAAQRGPGRPPGGPGGAGGGEPRGPRPDGPPDRD
jgi:Spy/CpxP family protein refolding chaperone